MNTESKLQGLELKTYVKTVIFPERPNALQAVHHIEVKGRSGVAATQTSPEQRRLEAKMVLKLGQWMADTGQGGRSDITGANAFSHAAGSLHGR